MDLKHLEEQLIRICRSQSENLKAASGRIQQANVEEKAYNHLVTEFDKQTELNIVNELKLLLPNSGFLTEENTENNFDSHSVNWIIDPIDGTTNFVYGIPVFSISIALRADDEIVLGIVYDPSKDEAFTAIKGGGARLNGETISVRRTKELAKAFLATGFPYFDFDRLDAYLDVLKELLKKSHSMRRMGSAAIDLAYVACGRFDAFFEYGLSPWDVAAGSLLVTEAGGTVSAFNGKGDFLFDGEIVAGTPLVQKELKEVIEHHFST